VKRKTVGQNHCVKVRKNAKLLPRPIVTAVTPALDTRRVLFSSGQKPGMNSRWVKSESLLNDADKASSPKPGGPLKPRLDAVQKKIEFQVSRLDEMHRSLKAKDDEIFLKLVSSIKENNAPYTTILSTDLDRARQLSRAVFLARVALEKIGSKLSSASDFGDLVIVLSPAMALVKNLRSSLTPLVPEMEEELGLISELLSGILVDAGQVGGYTINFETANEEAVRMLDEAAATVDQKMKEEFPGIPDLPAVMPA
jgi:division protein CdvB (Snf7/Vps24/ESCRT-III family)